MEKAALICIAHSVALPLTDCFKVHIISDTADAHTATMYMFHHFKKMIVIVTETTGIYCVIYACMCNIFFLLTGKDGRV